MTSSETRSNNQHVNERRAITQQDNWRTQSITSLPVCAFQIHWGFHVWPWIPSGNITPTVYLLLCISFCEMQRSIDNTGATFPEEFKATRENPSESELKQ